MNKDKVKKQKETKTFKIKDAHGKEQLIDITVAEDGQMEVTAGVATYAINIGCLLGIHAWRGGVCVVCGVRG